MSTVKNPFPNRFEYLKLAPPNLMDSKRTKFVIILWFPVLLGSEGARVHVSHKLPLRAVNRNSDAWPLTVLLPFCYHPETQ